MTSQVQVMTTTTEDDSGLSSGERERDFRAEKRRRILNSIISPTHGGLFLEDCLRHSLSLSLSGLGCQ